MATAASDPAQRTRKLFGNMAALEMYADSNAIMTQWFRRTVCKASIRWLADNHANLRGGLWALDLPSIANYEIICF